MKPEPVITVTGLHKCFKRGPEEISVLKGLNLEVGSGQGVSIIGASGTGKSTLLHLLGGLDKPDSGSICYGNKDICRMKEKELAWIRNHDIGFIFQFHFLLPEFTALENVMMPTLLHTWNPDDSRKRAMELLDIVGLASRVQHKPGELSGGEQQRVALARALAMSPGILLADEATGDLDPETGEKMIELFGDLKKKLGVTMIIATHNYDLAYAMDRVLILKGGQLESHHA